MTSWSFHKRAVDFGPALTQRQAAEEIESQAVREAGERTRQWRELGNRTAPGGEVEVASADGAADKVKYYVSALSQTTATLHSRKDVSPCCDRAFGAGCCRVLSCSTTCSQQANLCLNLFFRMSPSRLVLSVVGTAEKTAAPSAIA